MCHTALLRSSLSSFVLFFLNATATTEIYTLSLHDALPICAGVLEQTTVDLLDAAGVGERMHAEGLVHAFADPGRIEDRKSTRLNSSHRCISYAVFCLKKKKKKKYVN